MTGLTAVLLAGSVSVRAETTEQLETRLKRLPRLNTIIYVTAHPDDESAAILTYLAHGLHARVVLLCMTRGEGGQNQEGPELGEELGRVRSAELQRAVAGYGAEVRFMGAEDFGYSKSLKETLALWDEETLLERLVWHIRTLRPLAIISHWPDDRAPAGKHHEAAGLLTRRAFTVAGEESFPEHFQRGLMPWQARYLLLRSYRAEGEQLLEVPVQQPSPVPGKTYEELGWEAFQHHRSQGMHNFKLSDLSFRRHYNLQVRATLRDGPPAPVNVAELSPDLATLPDLFPTVEFLEGWRVRLAQVVELADRANRRLKEFRRDEAALALVQGAAILAGVRRDRPTGEPTAAAAQALAWMADKEHKYLRAAAMLAGVELLAQSDRATVSPGERAWVRLAVRAAAPAVLSAAGLEFGALRLETPRGWHVEPLSGRTEGANPSVEYLVSIPEGIDPRRVPAVPLWGRSALTTGSLRLELKEPVQGLARPGEERTSLVQRLDPRRLRRLLGGQADEEDEEEAELEPVSVAPAVTLEVEPRLRVVASSPGETTHDWCIRLESHRPDYGEVSAWFEVPIGWYTPVPQESKLGPANQRARLCFPLTLPGRIPPGRYELEAMAGRGIETFNLTRRPERGETGNTGYSYQPARAQVEVLDVEVPEALRIGYIGFNNDPLPALLAQLGIGVDMLDESALAREEPLTYDAIIVANRAYDYRADLREDNARLLDYVKAGGTLVLEHQGRRWDPARYAPYPGTKSGNRRVTVETAAVRVLTENHLLLTFPNHIEDADWKGWVQERGLYFWETWSDEYTPLLEMADPGLEPLRGSLLHARYGEGTYIYCGLGLFRQVRAGIPGGVRLYVNLLSQGRAHAQEKAATGTRSLSEIQHD